MIRPDEATQVADAIVRVFIDHGDRTNRAKARLKYVLDAWGFEKFLDGRRRQARTAPCRASMKALSRRGRCRTGRRMSASIAKSRTGSTISAWFCRSASSRRQQMRELASIAHDCGDGDIRLTVWQNLLISGIAEERLAEAQAADRRDRARLEGVEHSRRSRRLHRLARLQILRFRHQGPCRRDRRLVREPHQARSADQHPSDRLPSFLRPALYRRHRPLSARASPINEDGDTVDGYHVVVGGGFGSSAAIGRETFPRRQSRGRAAARRAPAQSLSRPSRRPVRKLPSLHRAA